MADTSLAHDDSNEATTVPLLPPDASPRPSRDYLSLPPPPLQVRDSFTSALNAMAAHRDSFNSMPMSQKGSTTHLYDPAAMDTPGRYSDAHQSWYSGSPLAEVAAQHSSSSPLAGGGVYQSQRNLGEKAAGKPSRGGFWGWCKRKPWLAGLLLLVLVAGVAGAAIGVTRSMSSSNDDSSQQSSTGSAGDHKGTTGGHGGTGTATGTSAGAPTPTAPVITPLPAWDWTDPRQKVMGVSLGNWLSIERWLDEDWFRSVAGEDTWDEWGLHRTLGPEKTNEVLDQHHKDYIQESDFDELLDYGMNTIRVPIPYWAFIPTAGNEPYHNGSQLERLSDVMQWAYKRQQYVIIDLHSMPGSQSGDQASGHNTSSPQFWTPANQARSIQTVQAVIDWVAQHPYKSTISGVCPVNEPNAQVNFQANDDEKLSILRTFYGRTYTMLSRARLPMIFHPTFYQGNALEYWADFVTGKDPNMLIYTVHPYPGFFPVKDDADKMMSDVCKFATNSIGYPVPIMYGEWSAISGIETVSYMKRYYETQLTAWSWSAGGLFWSYKAPVTQTPVLANAGMQETMFSFVDLMRLGVVPKPDTRPSTNPKDYGAYNFIRSLGITECGEYPLSQIGWKSPAAYSAGYSGRRRDIGDADSAQPQARRQPMRS